MDVVLLAPAEAATQQQQLDDVARPATVELMSFPAHRTLLSNSAVLWCRVSKISWGPSTPSHHLRSYHPTDGAHFPAAAGSCGVPPWHIVVQTPLTWT